MATTTPELLAFAETAQSDGYTLAAGMLAKAFLTRRLRQLYLVHGLNLKAKKRPPVHHMLGRLMGVGVVDPATVGELRYLVAAVNKHIFNGSKGHEAVGQLIACVERFAVEHPVTLSLSDAT